MVALVVHPFNYIREQNQLADEVQKQLWEIAALCHLQFYGLEALDHEKCSLWFSSKSLISGLSRCDIYNITRAGV